MSAFAVSDAQVKGRLGSLLSRHEAARAEKAAADDGIDSQVRQAIEAAISLQQSDPDLDSHEADRRVLEILHSALEAQFRDESSDSPSSGGGY